MTKDREALFPQDGEGPASEEGTIQMRHRTQEGVTHGKSRVKEVEGKVCIKFLRRENFWHIQGTEYVIYSKNRFARTQTWPDCWKEAKGLAQRCLPDVGRRVEEVEQTPFWKGEGFGVRCGCHESSGLAFQELEEAPYREDGKVG
jgi:hypothetical protein